MPTKNIRLSERQLKFITKRIERGGYRDAGEIVGAGLRLLEQQEKEAQVKLKLLRRVAKDAFDEIDRGEFDVLEISDLDRFLSAVDKRARIQTLK